MNLRIWAIGQIFKLLLNIILINHRLHTNITYNGRVPRRIDMYEEYNKENSSYNSSAESGSSEAFTGAGAAQETSGGAYPGNDQVNESEAAASNEGNEGESRNEGSFGYEFRQASYSEETRNSSAGAQPEDGAASSQAGTSYSFNKRDLYEPEYVVNDSASEEASGRFYDADASGGSTYEEPRWEPNPDKYNSYNGNNANNYNNAGGGSYAYDPGNGSNGGYSGGYASGGYSSGNSQPPKKKKRKLWLIPLIVVLALMVAFICVGVWYGFKYVDEYIASADSDTEDSSETDENTELNIVDSSDSSSSGIVLTDVSEIVEEVMPAVVSITSRTYVNNYSSFWGYSFGGSSDDTSEEVESGIGSGTIVGTNDTELLILTSYHVVEDSSSLYVTFCDDESVEGYIKSVSEDYDIAVVAVLLEDILDSTLESITIATICTEQASVGEGVVVIGDALGYGQSVTTGIVSAVDREITVENRTISVIQTDAAINSGNSGGCLLNSSGQIIGISEAKISSDSVEGMCYAISVNVYADLIEELLTTTTETETDSSDEEETTTSNTASTQTAYLGIQGVDVDSSTASSYNMVEGVYVAAVVSGGGAEAAGVQEGDIIVGLDGTSLTTMSELQSLLANYSAGDTVTLTVMRSSGSGYSSLSLQVTLTSQIQ